MTPPDSMDEMVDGGREVRAPWRGLFAAMHELGRDELAERNLLLARAAEEQGGTSLVEAERGPSWRCDAIPLVLSGAEFAQIERGLAQRANVLQALLADLYGPCRLLEEGLVAPDAVYTDPAFLRSRRDRPLDAAATPAAMLHCYAADLVRGADRSWRVVADRIADPSGLGYVRESRRLMKRVLPEGFRAQPVRNLRPFFDLQQDTLLRLAPAGEGAPGLAILTPGAGDPDWFEHMLLARELSCALVEAGDLTVRHGRLFLKTLRGLQRIDVLVSRGRGSVSDPLESEGAGLQGVTGLMDALRHGAVAMVNDPGATIAEAPALRALLPDLAPFLIGAPLQLAQLAEEAAIEGSVTPTVTRSGLEPLPFRLRVFLGFDGERWRALPGGLARIVSRARRDDPEAGLIKDVWIVDHEEPDIVGPAALVQAPLPVRRGTGDLPGRIADNFFWLGRYLERLESGARLVRITASRLGREISPMRDAAAIDALSACLGHAELIDPEVTVGLGAETLVRGLVRTARPRGPLTRSLGNVTRLTDILRDRLTADMYGVFIQSLKEAVEGLRQLDGAPRWRSLDTLSHAMIAVLRFSATVAGLAAENMVQGGGRLFLDLGRRMERAQTIAAMIGIVLDRAAHPARIGLIEDWLRLILELADSSITYRSRYLTLLQPAPALDLVLADDGNPRALAFQLSAMRTLLSDVAGSTEAHLVEACDALIAELATLTRALPADLDVATTALIAKRLRRIGTGCGALSDELARRYFALLPPRQAVGTGLAPALLRGAA